MWKRLFERKKPAGLPEYAAIVANPRRGDSAELAAAQKSEAFRSRQAEIQEELRQRRRQSGDEAPLLFELLSDRSPVTLMAPDGDAKCLLAFTTPIRAADYRRTRLSGIPALQELSSSATQFLGLLARCQRGGIEAFTIDHCPRCAFAMPIEIDSLETTDDVVLIWSVVRGSEVAHAELSFAHAMKAAREGRFETARDVGLETVAHVSAEDPRLHLLLGQVAVGLGDETLLDDARTFLTFLGQDPLVQRLDDDARRGSPDFSDPQVSGW